MCYRRRDSSARFEILLAIAIRVPVMLILVAVLTVVSILLFSSLLFVVSSSREQIIDAYTGGRADQIELESIVELIERDDPDLFGSEIEQLVAEQLIERFGELVEATIVAVDGTEHPVGEWDEEHRLEFYRQLRATGH